MSTHAGRPATLAFLILSLVATPTLSADDSARAIFNEANALYAQKRYEEAANLYWDLVQDGVESPSLYYNLANAFYKCGKVGRAIQYYEKAKKLLPRDRDVAENLAFGRKQVAEARPDEGLAKAILERTVFAFTVGELVAAESVSVLLFSALGILAMSVHRRTWKKGITISLLLSGSLLVLSLLFLSVHLVNGRTTRAIIVEDRVEAMSGPGEDFVRVLSIPEGTMVWVDEKRGGWSLIHLATGRGGWVRHTSLGII